MFLSECITIAGRITQIKYFFCYMDGQTLINPRSKYNIFDEINKVISFIIFWREYVKMSFACKEYLIFFSE